MRQERLLSPEKDSSMRYGLNKCICFYFFEESWEPGERRDSRQITDSKGQWYKPPASNYCTYCEPWTGCSFNGIFLSYTFPHTVFHFPLLPSMKVCARGDGGFLAVCMGCYAVWLVCTPAPGLPLILLVEWQKSAQNQKNALLYINTHCSLAFFLVHCGPSWSFK